MDNMIQKVLADLYALDPSLRQHEPQLIEMIKALVAAKPIPRLDEAFVASLRERLNTVITQSGPAQETHRATFIHNLFFMKKIYFGAAMAVIALAIIVPTVYFTQRPGGPIARQPSLASEIVALPADQAFGSLALQSGESFGRRESGGGGGIPAMAPSLGMDQAESSKAVSVGMGSAGITMTEPAPNSLIYPGYYSVYRYVYKGEPLGDQPAQLDVYKRVKGIASSINAGNLLEQLNFGLVDFGSFSNTKLQSLNVIEDKEFGYNIYLDFNEGVVTISENWLRWVRPDAQCRDEECFARYRIQEGDIPSDDELIRIAGDFLRQHGVDTDDYGAPEVMNEWRTMYARETNRAAFYFPDTLTVIYPFKIKDTTVYEEGGTKAGLNVNINIRARRASGLWNLTIPKYQSSAYQTEQDAAKILQVAEKGGVYGWYPQDDPNAKVIDVELGTPTLALMRYWSYRENTNDELYVPAYVFPVVKQPEGEDYFYRTAVVVPVIKEMLEQPGGGPIMYLEKPMPLPAVQDPAMPQSVDAVPPQPAEY